MIDAFAPEPCAQVRTLSAQPWKGAQSSRAGPSLIGSVLFDVLPHRCGILILDLNPGGEDTGPLRRLLGWLRRWDACRDWPCSSCGRAACSLA
jgi:hypothetical protein